MPANPAIPFPMPATTGVNYLQKGSPKRKPVQKKACRVSGEKRVSMMLGPLRTPRGRVRNEISPEPYGSGLVGRKLVSGGTAGDVTLPGMAESGREALAGCAAAACAGR